MEQEIRKLYQKICVRVDQRANLTELKNQLKTEENRQAFRKICADNYDVIMKCLVEKDPKVRKNAAAILGEMCVQDAADVLMDAYVEEETRFVRPEYVDAMAKLDCTEYLPEFHKRLDELTAYDAPENEKKHVQAEIRALRELLLAKEGWKKHSFVGFDRANDVVLTTGSAFRDVLAESISSKKVLLKSGVRMTVGDMHDLLQNRLWQEMLFVLHSEKRAQHPEQVARLGQWLLGSDLMRLLTDNHSGKTPFYFRIGVQGLPREEHGGFAKEAAKAVEEAFDGQLINSASHYEMELRLQVKKDGEILPFLKLFTLPDRRFAYRKYSLAAGMKPTLAAGLMALAKPYLKEYAQVLDPFCGVGTLLIERQRAVPSRNLYGVDTFGEAVEKARTNTKLAGLTANYINRDYFDFTHAYLFDEIVTDPPVRANREESDRLYRDFFEKSAKMLAEHGRIVLYSGEMGLVKKYLRLQNQFRLLKEFCISEKNERYLFILELRTR